MTCNFTFKHYEETLTKAKGIGYEFLKFKDFKDIENKKLIILLRHDIDLPLTVHNALKFAKIENRLGIAATYFVRVTGKYNPFFYKNYMILKKIKELGHEIGLHYSLDFSELTDEDQHSVLIREKKVLESILNEKIIGASAHDPSRGTDMINDDNLAEFGLKYTAYSPIFLKEIKYISDSGGRWREGCMCQFIGKVPKLCILTHPFWWFKISYGETW